MVSDEDLRNKYAGIIPLVDERQRRLIAAADAISLGRGGVSKIARTSGLSRMTVHTGIAELREGGEPKEGIRREGGGRKRIIELEPCLIKELEALLEPDTRGDPMSPLRWTCKGTRQLAGALSKKGFEISYPVVAELLHELGYSLQANVKTIEGKDHPDRDKQFEYINAQVKARLQKKLPVISVDTKKKELGGGEKT